MKGRMKIGAKKDGTLTSLEASMYFADGCYGDTGAFVVTVAGQNCMGPYVFEQCKVDAYGVYTNTPPVGAAFYLGCAIGEVSVSKVVKSIWPFMAHCWAVTLSPSKLRVTSLQRAGWSIMQTATTSSIMEPPGLV